MSVGVAGGVTGEDELILISRGMVDRRLVENLPDVEDFALDIWILGLFPQRCKAFVAKTLWGAVN